MRLLFVHQVVEDRGSAQDMHHYARAAAAAGHEVALFGRGRNGSVFHYSHDIDSADAVVFIFEWTTGLGDDGLHALRLLTKIPRRRRVVIDCDGKYNDALRVAGDANHPDQASARQWVEACDVLSDKICQPSLQPRRPNVRPFLFHAYHPGWEQPLDFSEKEFGVCYVGNNWFRWRPLRRLLQAVEPVRERVGRIGLVGNGWASPAPWALPWVDLDAYTCDSAYLERLGVEVLPPVPFSEVVPCMGRAVLSPVIYRPLFDHLRLVTCRTFETPASAALPVFCQDPGFVEEIYGPAALELVLPASRPVERLETLLHRPARYAPAVAAIRRHLAERHSYAARLRQLIDIVED